MQDQIQQVNKFLKGELPYDVGVLLYKTLSKNKLLLRYFLLPYSAEREKKLKYELQKYTKQHETPSQFKALIQNDDLKSSTGNEPEDATFIAQATNKNIPSSDRYRYLSSGNDVPGLNTRILNQRKELYRMRGHYHGQLHTARTDEERHQLAIKIMDAQDQINKLNRDLRMIEAGSTPSEYLKQDKTADEYVKIKNLKMYIARFEKKLGSCNSIDERNKILSILEKHKSELKRLT